MSKLPEIPRLFYSTWGSDFYSEHWLKPVNCWMFGMIKFIEENIDLAKDTDALDAFAKFAGSDLMFIYPDPSQRALVHDVFIKQYETVFDAITIKKRDVICTYPVDPFKTLFVYVTLDKPDTKPQFIIDKTSLSTGQSLHQIKLEPEYMEASNLHIYYQFFMVPPDTTFTFRVEETAFRNDFTTPTFGVPLYVVKELKVWPKYNQKALFEKLKAIWGQKKEDIPVIENRTKFSQSIYTKEHLNQLLGGKRAAIFKYNKEFYSLLRFQELTTYELQVVFDESISLGDASEYNQHDARKVSVINDVEKINDYDFDVLIFTCALNFETEVPFFKALMKYVLKKNIPVLSLYDDVLQYDIFDGADVNPSLFYHIGLPKGQIIPEHRLTPQETASNVLCVFGTDTVQGKFTTQLYLREALKKYISVGHWATEPTGAILGAEIGYSRVEEGMTFEDRLTLERANFNALANQFDVVITGGQNSIIFAPPGGTKEDNVSTSIFETYLPRYIVLTVSVDTATKQVEDSIAYVAELAAKYQIKSGVVALAMMGGRKIRGGRWTETYFAQVDATTIATAKKKLNDAFGLPLFVVPDEIDELAKEISKINFLDE